MDSSVAVGNSKGVGSSDPAIVRYSKVIVHVDGSVTDTVPALINLTR